MRYRGSVRVPGKSYGLSGFKVGSTNAQENFKNGNAKGGFGETNVQLGGKYQ